MFRGRAARLPQVPISNLRYRDNHGCIRPDCFLQFATKSGDVRVDGAAIEIEVDAIVPDTREQLVAGNDALLVLEEVHQ